MFYFIIYLLSSPSFKRVLSHCQFAIIKKNFKPKYSYSYLYSFVSLIHGCLTFLESLLGLKMQLQFLHYVIKI